MSFIGNSTQLGVTSVSTVKPTELRLLIRPEYIYTAVANEEVFEMFVYEGEDVPANVGGTLRSAVYDVTNSQVNAVKVAGTEVTIAATGIKQLLSAVLPSAVSLTQGNKYAACCISEAKDFKTLRSDYQGTSTRKQTSSSILPATLSTGGTEAYAPLVYAETRFTVATVVITGTSNQDPNGVPGTIKDGDTPFIVSFTGGSATGNTVTISAVNDINDPDALTQNISFQLETQAIFTANLPPLQDSEEDGVYIFVTDDNGVESNGFNIPVTASLQSFPHAVKLDEICSSTLGFNIGMVAYKNKTLAGEVVSTSIEAVDTLQTATPNFNIIWPDGLDAINGVDTLHIEYTDTTGDIKSVATGKPLESVLFESDPAMVCA